MSFHKGDRVRFSAWPSAPTRSEEGTIVEVTQDRKGRTHYEVQRDADPSGPDFLIQEEDVEKA